MEISAKAETPFKGPVSKPKSVGGKIWNGVKTFGSGVAGAIKNAGIFGAGALLGGLFGGSDNSKGAGQHETHEGGDGLSIVPEPIDSVLTGIPSGGDLGVTGTSHFGGASLEGKSVAEILTRIYELTLSHGDYLRAIADNTRQMLKFDAKSDAANDILTANQKARMGEHKHSSATPIIQNHQFEESLVNNEESRTKDKSDLSKKVSEYVKKGIRLIAKGATYTAVASLLGIDDDAEANMGQYSTDIDIPGGHEHSMQKKPSGFMDNLFYNFNKKKTAQDQPIDSGDFANIRQQIKKYESAGGNYNILVGGETKSDLSKMTFGEVKQYQQEHMGQKHGLASDAVGAYQFIGSTLAETQKAAGLSDTDVFSPENQDKLANTLIQQAYKASGGDIKKFASLLAGRWAAFGNPLRPGGKNDYDTGGVNKTLVSAEKVMEAAQKDIDILNNPEKTGLEFIDSAKAEKVIDKKAEVSELENLQKNSPYAVSESTDRFVPISSTNGEEKIFDKKTNKVYDKGLAPTASAVDIQHNALALAERTLNEDVRIKEMPTTTESITSAVKDLGVNIGNMVASIQPQQIQQPQLSQVNARDVPVSGTGTSRVPSALNQDPTIIAMIKGNLMTA